jgi:hypothetical protein
MGRNVVAKINEKLDKKKEKKTKWGTANKQ